MEFLLFLLYQQWKSCFSIINQELQKVNFKDFRFFSSFKWTINEPKVYIIE